MNGRELVRLAIAHEETERIPYCVTFTPEAERQLKSSFPEGELQSMMSNCIRHVTPPWWEWHEVPPSYMRDEAPDYMPATIGTGCYEDFFAECRRIRETSDEYVLATIWGSHFEKAYFARGIENFLADLAGDREYAIELLRTIIRKNLVMLENIIHCDDIDGILLGSDWGAQRSLLMAPETWRELIAPGEKLEYDLVHSTGKHVWLHSCGNIEAILPDLVKMGLDVLNPLQPECMNVLEIKRDFGKSLTFWGGISTQRTLPCGTPDEVREETRSLVFEMRRGGGYIAGPSQAIQEDVPSANALALVEVLKELG